MSNKTVVRVVLVDGSSWVTEINTDFDGAAAYYFGAGSFENADETVVAVDMVIQLGPDDSVVRVAMADDWARRNA